MKKVFLMILGTAAFIAVVGYYTNGKPFQKPTTKEVKINNTAISVEMADTATKRAKGLSGRTELGNNSGMLFVIDPKDNEPIFWMKGMLVPIDIIWIKNNQIIQIGQNVPIPAPNTADKDLKLYKPSAPVDYVLEVNVGFTFKNNIKVGDKIN